MKHSVRFEQFLGEDLALHPSVHWMQKGDEMENGKVPISVQKEFIDTLEKDYAALDKPTIHPAERIEYVVARLYPVTSLSDTEVASEDEIQDTLFNLTELIGKEIIAWQPKIQYDLSPALLSSVITHKKYKEMPLVERGLSDIEIAAAKIHPEMDGEPMLNNKVEAVDIRQFIEKYTQDSFSVGVNEGHAFLPIQTAAYLKAIECAGGHVDPRVVVGIFNSLVFEGELVRPCFTDLQVSRGIGRILLAHLAQTVPPCHLPAILTCELPLRDYKNTDPRLGVYDSMKQLIRVAQHNDPGGPQNPEGRGPRE